MARAAALTLVDSNDTTVNVDPTPDTARARYDRAVDTLQAVRADLDAIRAAQALLDVKALQLPRDERDRLATAAGQWRDASRADLERARVDAEARHDAAVAEAFIAADAWRRIAGETLANAESTLDQVRAAHHLATAPAMDRDVREIFEKRAGPYLEHPWTARRLLLALEDAEVAEEAARRDRKEAKAALATATRDEHARLIAPLVPRHREAVARVVAAVEELSAALEAESDVRAEGRSLTGGAAHAKLPDVRLGLLPPPLGEREGLLAAWAREMRRRGLVG